MKNKNVKNKKRSSCYLPTEKSTFLEPTSIKYFRLLIK